MEPAVTPPLVITTQVLGITIVVTTAEVHALSEYDCKITGKTVVPETKGEWTERERERERERVRRE